MKRIFALGLIIVAVLLGGSLFAVAFYTAPIPFAFAATIPASEPSAQCNITAPLGIQSATGGFHLSNLSSSFSFSAYNLHNRSTIRSTIDGGVKLTLHKHGITNESIALNLNGLSLNKNSTVSLARGDAYYYANKTLDSYIHISGFKFSSTNYNATILKLTVSASHFELSTGNDIDNFANSSGTPKIPSGISLSLDNFRLVFYWNCKTGSTSFATQGTTTPATIANLASTLIRAGMSK